MLFSFFMNNANSQIWLTGKVYDSTRMISIPSVKVSSTKGEVAFTDSLGRYAMPVQINDSVFFTYRGKSTTLFPVKSIRYPAGFDIALQVRVQDKYQTLKEVVVIGKSYKQDSVENREYFSRVFNFDRGGMRISETGTMGGTPGLDLGSMIQMFQFRKNKSMKKFQNRLIDEEQNKFVDHKFNKQLIQQLTKLSGRDLEKFMVVYRPPYEFVAYSQEYEFLQYILDASKYFKQGKMPNEFIRK
jgi:hypothetical protein